MIGIATLIVLLVVIVLGIIFVIVLAGFSKLFGQEKSRFSQSLNLAFFKIEKTFFEKPEFSEKFYNFLHSFKENWFRTFEYGRYWVVFEMVKWPKGLEFYFACQRKEKKFILDNFSKFWPDFKIGEVKAPNFFAPGEAAQGFEISLEKSFLLPIKTYELSNNLFERIIEIFEKSRGKMVMQVLARPVFYSLKKMPLNEKSIVKTPLNAGSITRKSKKPAFEFNVRFLSPAGNLKESEINLIALKNLFEGIYYNDYNNLKVEKSGNLNEFVFNFIFRSLTPSRDNILNSEELATVFHL